MGSGRLAEEWARRVVSIELGTTAVRHDDGSRPSMYDIRVGPSAAPALAMEVVGAVDQLRTETWNVGPARGGVDLPGMAGRWTIVVRPGADIRRLRRDLPAALTTLHALGVRSLHDSSVLQYGDKPIFDLMTDLGIEAVDHYESELPGLAYLTMDGVGGAIDGTGAALPVWIVDFLSDPKRADVLRKLDVPAEAREAFVAVTLDGAPWEVVSYLTEISAMEHAVPSEAPDLPAPLTGVWVVSTTTFGEGVGVRWDGRTWRSFRARGEGIDEEDERRTLRRRRASSSYTRAMSTTSSSCWTTPDSALSSSRHDLR